MFKIEEPIKKITKSLILCGDSLEVMKNLPDKSIDLVFTSPPYAGLLRKYSQDSRDLGQLSVEIFKEKFMDYVHEICRILRHESGCCFVLNLGPKYESGYNTFYAEEIAIKIRKETPLSLVDSVPWCLSQDTILYAKTQKGEIPTTIREVVRLL